MPTRYYCEKCRRIMKRGPTCETCGGSLSRHDLKMSRFRVISILCWALAIFFLFWPFFTPESLLGFFYLAFLFVAIAIPMQWLDARTISMKVMREIRGPRSPKNGPR